MNEEQILKFLDDVNIFIEFVGKITKKSQELDIEKELLNQKEIKLTEREGVATNMTKKATADTKEAERVTEKAERRNESSTREREAILSRKRKLEISEGNVLVEEKRLETRMVELDEREKKITKLETEAKYDKELAKKRRIKLDAMIKRIGIKETKLDKRQKQIQATYD